MTLHDFIERSNQAHSAECLVQDFTDFLSMFGMDCFVMGEISHDTTVGKEQNLGLLFNYPKEWLDRYIANHYVECDPVYQAVRTARRPFAWTEVVEGKNLSDEARQVMNEAREFGLHSGIALSIHRPMGRIIGMGIASSEKDARCDRDAISTIYAAANQLYLVFSELEGIEEKESSPCLSQREREVLGWLAMGKSKSEISHILLVSESTVKRHCESAFKKLDVGNAPHAVTKAFRMGFIHPY